MKVLVVEDEKKIASFVAKGLREAGFEVVVCHDGGQGYEKASSSAFDALVLDIMLPGRDGLSILRQLRDQGHNVPILVLTGRSALNERLEGLDLGADDYLTKPFYVEELVARVHAIMRRHDGQRHSVISVGSLRLDLLQRQANCGDQVMELTTREFNLLAYLARSPGRVFTRTQILERVWNYDFDPSTNIVDVYIQRLRGKLASHRALIETIRGVGYRVRAEGGGGCD